MIDLESLSPYFEKLHAHLGDDIVLNIGNRTYNANRCLLTSHSAKLKEIFGDPQIKSFTITDNIDPDAFEFFLEFVNKHKIDFNRYNQIDKLYNIAIFYEAEVFGDYLVMNFNFIDYQFNQILTYENQGKSTKSLIEKLSTRIAEIINNWGNVHKVNLDKLLAILQKADLTQFAPQNIFNFCLNSIKYRGEQSIKILKLFNLSALPFDNLLILSKVASQHNIKYDFFEKITEIDQQRQQLQENNENILMQLKTIPRNKTETKSSLEFKVASAPNKSVQIQAIPSNNTKNNFLLLVIGKEKVGKTTLISKYYFLKSEKDEKNDLKTKNIIKDIKVNFLYFADNEAFYETSYAAVLRVQMIIFVCSPDIKGSVQYCNAFYKKALNMRNAESIPNIVFWNKSDLEGPAVENQEEAQEFAESIGSSLISGSAKTGSNVMNIYDEIIKNLVINDQKSCIIW